MSELLPGGARERVAGGGQHRRPDPGVERERQQQGLVGHEELDHPGQEPWLRRGVAQIPRADARKREEAPERLRVAGEEGEAADGDVLGLGGGHAGCRPHENPSVCVYVRNPP